MILSSAFQHFQTLGALNSDFTLKSIGKSEKSWFNGTDYTFEIAAGLKYGKTFQE